MKSQLDSGIPHDERIDDGFYGYGWTHVSTVDECEKSGCECIYMGMCPKGIFNHYLIEDENLSPIGYESPIYGESRVSAGAVEQSSAFFPIRVSEGTADSIGVEEITCEPHTLGSTYAYYRRNIPKGDQTVTLVSIAVASYKSESYESLGYKSPCFNMDCYLLKMEKSAVPRRCVTFSGRSIKPSECWVLSRGSFLSDSLLLSICEIGIDPLAGERYDTTPVLPPTWTASMERAFAWSGFIPVEGGPNILWNPDSSSSVVECAEGKVKAVKTAQVTVSILLTPKSMHGGKNPSSKLVSYLVHNLCYGGDM